MNLDKHPVKLLQKLESNYPGSTFKFAVYKPNTDAYSQKFEYKGLRSIEGSALAVDLPAYMSETSNYDLDVVVLSEVSTPDGAMHIPMVDFVADPALDPTEFDMKAVSEHCGLWPATVVYYKTGRSFHAYWPELLSKTRWLNLMGALLLVNQVNKPPVVDTRWVGHRLINRCGALRLTCTSSKYLQAPERWTKPAPDPLWDL